MNKKIRNLLLSIPPRNFYYTICKWYINSHQYKYYPPVTFNPCHMDKNGELETLKKNIPMAQIVFDVGANIGDWTRDAIKINQHASFHCFEPSSKIYSALKKISPQKTHS